MRWMLDTDTCIGLIRFRHERALRRLQSKTIGQVGLSSITLSELAFGVSRSSKPQQNRSALDQFLLALEVVPFDSEAANEAGDVRARLAVAGTPIGPMDTLIAAHARSLDVTLVTHNRREFRCVKGLRVEDWLAP
jgi:tRNA(fMet)-specific endonuclease VapC